MRYLIFCYSVCVVVVRSPKHSYGSATWLLLFRTETAKAFSNRFIKVNGFAYAALSIAYCTVARLKRVKSGVCVSHELCEKYWSQNSFTSRINPTYVMRDSWHFWPVWENSFSQQYSPIDFWYHRTFPLDCQGCHILNYKLSQCFICYFLNKFASCLTHLT